MKKILLFVSELSYSGTPNSTLRLARVFKNNGNYVELWSYKDGPFADEYARYEIPVHVVAKYELRNHKIVNLAKKFDFMVANSILTSEAYEAISSIIPTYWYVREAENIPEFFESNPRRGHVLTKSHNIVTVSEYAASFIRNYFNSDVKVLHNCVDDCYEDYKNIGKDVNYNCVDIILIGAIERRKNQCLMVEAYKLLSNDLKEKSRIHFVGKTPDWGKDYSDTFFELIKDEPGIIYHGEICNRDEMMSLINRCDVLSVISTDESCSLTALEGAMMSKPLLLSENVGAKYLLTNENGWLVHTDDVLSLKGS